LRIVGLRFHWFYSNGDHSLATEKHLDFQHFKDNPTTPIIQLARRGSENHKRFEPTLDGEADRAVVDRKADPLGQESADAR
jgi:hypothetical protein